MDNNYDPTRFTLPQNDQNALAVAAVVVVVVPLPAQGHMNQLLHLSRLLAAHGLPVHFAGAAFHNRRATRRTHGWDPLSTPNLHFHDLQNPPNYSPASTNYYPSSGASNFFPSHLVPVFKSASQHLRLPVAALLRRLAPTAKRLVIVHDSLMASVVQDAAAIPNAESFTFHSVSAFAILLFYCEKGVVPVEAPSFEGCMTPEMLEFIAAQYEFNKRTSGNLYNTALEIEAPFLSSLARVLPHKKHFAVGPFHSMVASTTAGKCSMGTKRQACLEWLDGQGPGSVVYVSFGTTTTFGKEQEREIGTGLRESGYNFLWAAREADRGDGFSDGEPQETRKSEMEESGMVVREWAPQTEILAHPAVGGFVSHCGWNSCVEGIYGGVPMGTWPMHSDQPRNAVLLTEVLRVGVPVREWRDRADVATAATVAEGVRRLMGATEVRMRAAKLGRDLRRSLGEGDGRGGSKELEAFIAHITG